MNSFCTELFVKLVSCLVLLSYDPAAAIFSTAFLSVLRMTFTLSSISRIFFFPFFLQFFPVSHITSPEFVSLVNEEAAGLRNPHRDVMKPAAVILSAALFLFLHLLTQQPTPKKFIHTLFIKDELFTRTLTV